MQYIKSSISVAANGDNFTRIPTLKSVSAIHQEHQKLYLESMDVLLFIRPDLDIKLVSEELKAWPHRIKDLISLAHKGLLMPWEYKKQGITPLYPELLF